MFFGPLKNPKNQTLKDLSLREAFVLVPMIVLVFLLGLFPNILLSRVEKSVNNFLEDVKGRGGISKQVSPKIYKYSLFVANTEAPDGS